MQATQRAGAEWTKELIRFLEEQPGVAAVRLNTADMKVSVATIGQIDTTQLETQIQHVLLAIEAKLAEGRRSPAPVAQPGFVVKQSGSVTTVARPTCETAPSFYRWQEYSLPETAETEHDDDHGHGHGGGADESEWKLLATLATVCGVAGLAAFASSKFGATPPVVTSLYVVALMAGGWDAAIDSWANIRRRKLDIHFLMLAVALGAVAVGAWGEAVLLLFLFSGAGAMEAFAMERTQREVSALLHTAPKLATIVATDGSQKVVSVDELKIGDRLIVKPGEMFAADGDVTKGETASDESNLTGESVPVEKGVGASVFSGTINLWGSVEVTVQRLPSESTLQKIVRLIQTAQKLKAPSQRFTDRFGGNYTLLVLGATALMFLVWWLGFDLPPFKSVDGQASAFYRAMTLLVVASPCALVLSIPSAVLAAIAWGARHGVLFRGGAAIEKLAEIDTVALDKTGTLTTGELAVVSVESFPHGREREVLELAYALERHSHHPIARAVTLHARREGVTVREVAKFESITGQGVRGKFADGNVVLGRRELLAAGPFAQWLEKVPPAEAEFSEVWVVAHGIVGRLLLKDQLRAESRGVLAKLHARGIRSIMLTGDRRHTAESVAKEIGLDEVRAGLSPEQKVEIIDALGREGRKVAMVGDGVNDAPCLAASYVAVAMGARGSDAALEQSEVVLMHDRIENFVAALQLSRRARRIIRQNLVISLGTVVLMVLAALAGVIPLSIGVVAHEGSTVVVCLNSLRLLFGKNE
ncbi:MAG: heavy metal translocating P-type ATPase [Opitutus sp.]|nr:heavy metal translocating P-type ATPase [Opitutus sp.]